MALLPTSLFVQTGTDDRAHVQFSSQVAPPLRLDQIDLLYRLVKQLERAELTVDEASQELDAVSRLHADNPIRLLVAPLVTFLPGGMLAIATMEIAAGQMVSGAGRLVNGFVQLALLAFGIVAAGSLTQIVGTGPDVAARAMSEVLVTIISISLGVLTGAAAHRAADAGFRRLTRTPS